MLKGYAGTGKTTLVSALVKSLPAIGKRSVKLQIVDLEIVHFYKI